MQAGSPLIQISTGSVERGRRPDLVGCAGQRPWANDEPGISPPGTGIDSVALARIYILLELSLGRWGSTDTRETDNMARGPRFLGPGQHREKLQKEHPQDS
jgi:hypothetical protein